MPLLTLSENNPREIIDKIAWEKIPSYPEHGGNPSSLAKAFDVRVEKLVDFSASLNGFGIPSVIKPIMEHWQDALSHYPEPESKSFIQKLSSNLEVPSGQLLACNGSTELIHLLPRIWPRGTSVLSVVPCFSEYSRAFRSYRIPVQTFHYDFQNNHSNTFNQLKHSIKSLPSLGGIIIGHPASPMGMLWNPTEICELKSLCATKNIFFVVDETFIEFAGMEYSSWDENYIFSKHIVIRSLTKLYSIPGIRLGYGVMVPQWKSLIESRQVPWSVNSLAQQIGTAVLDDSTFVSSSREFLLREKSYLVEQLKTIGGIKVFPSDANFLLFKLETEDQTFPKRFFLSLLKKGIVIRCCQNFEGMNPSFFRIMVRDREDNSLLISNIQDIMNEEGY